MLKILVIDVGGSHIKVLVTGETTHREVVSGPQMTAAQMVSAVQQLCADLSYDVVSIGYPGPVAHNRPLAEPHNMGAGWVGFDYAEALARPVRMINDAAMQALGSYRGGRMLFLGLGTGLGSALIVDGVIEPMELAHLPYKDGQTYEEFVGTRGHERLGDVAWRAAVADVTERLRAALLVDEVVLGGGAVKALPTLPTGARAGDNDNAFAGGFRMWSTPSTGTGTAAVPSLNTSYSHSAEPLVFLFDVDNTLLDNDRVITDLRRFLVSELGRERMELYFEIFEREREALGYADYLGALQTYRRAHPCDSHVLAASSFLIDYPFANRLFPGSLDAIEHAATLGKTTILSDGDVVFQPRKLERSGLLEAVERRVLIYIHKELELDDVEKRFPASHYVLVDDKLRILTAVKQRWAGRVTTVFPRQGHYAFAPEVQRMPAADITIERIGDLVSYDSASLLKAARTPTLGA
jgi:polyphosphate glucokinase